MLIARRLLFYGLYNTENVMNEITGTCGQDPMLLPPFFSSFFSFFFVLNIDFFSYKQHFATFYVSV
jgi:hypothetical protein